MKAIFRSYCLPRNKKADYEAEDIRLIVQFNLLTDFIPQVGWSVKLTPNGEFLTVQDIHLDLTTSTLDILVELPEGWHLPSWPEMKAEGWKLG